MGGGPNGGGSAGGRRDEVVLITGCSDGGIGAALANEFCKAGFSVVATSRSLDTMKSFKGHPHVEILALDVSVEESVKAAVDVVMSMYGRIDILVNNAGMPCNSPLAETPVSLMEKVYRTNFLGTKTLALPLFSSFFTHIWLYVRLLLHCICIGDILRKV
jgi:NAD(P)-dependent dehydrogenase (short-subunit alcohol dehydrogenase family)